MTDDTTSGGPERLADERWEADADGVLELVEALELAIDAEDEPRAGAVAADLRAQVELLGLGWLDALTARDVERASEVAGYLALAYEVVAEPGPEELGSAVWWGSVEAELVGGLEALSPERARDLVETRVRHCYGLAVAGAPAAEVWESAAALLPLEAYWPDLSEIGGPMVLLALVGRAAAVAGELGVAEILVRRAVSAVDESDHTLRADLLATTIHLAHRRGRTEELRRLLPGAFALARTSGSSELSELALGIAIGMEMAGGVGRSLDELVAALEGIGAPAAAVRLRVELLRAWPRVGQVENWLRDVDPGVFERVAQRSDPTTDPGPHTISLVMAAMIRADRGELVAARAALQGARDGLARARSTATGGFAESGFELACDLAEASVLMLERRVGAARTLMSTARDRALSDRSWLMAAVMTAVIAITSPPDQPGTLELDVEAMALAAAVRELLPSSVERSDLRKSLAMVTANAFEHADRQGDQRAIAELIELLRAQSMPTSSVSPEEDQWPLSSLIAGAAAVALSPQLGQPWEEERDEVLILSAPARVRMPWGASRVSATLRRVDELVGRPRTEDVGLTVPQ